MSIDDVRGTGFTPRSNRTLENLTLAHVGVFLVGATWAFGGNTDWARLILSSWGSIGVVLTLVGFRNRATHDAGNLVPISTLWPLFLFNVLVLASTFNPSFREIHRGTETLFIPDSKLPRFPFWPSTARVDLSLRALWFFDAAYLAGFNLWLNVASRRRLRLLLLIVVVNAMVLSVFGTLQQLVSASGLYFGAIKTVQPHFFATFIYHNHWAAFATLMATAAVGLTFHFGGHGFRRFSHSPGFVTLVGVALLAATMPLSTSRSGTLLVLLVIAIAFTHWATRAIPRQRAQAKRPTWPLVAATVGVLAVGFSIYQLAEPIIRVRVDATRAQIAAMRDHGEIFPRQVLYRDTWNLARDKIWFGWGMASYPTAFYLRNTQHESHDGPVRLFHDAHSDWLQSLTEVGLIGTALLALCALVPFYQTRPAFTFGVIPLYLLLGCGLLLAYAGLEFPFGNRAVVIAFWFCFFGALQYARLDRANASGR